jgi:phenylalanyl-tRNA synthetase beta chain
MLVSYKWLSQYVDLSGVTAHELAEKITRAGVEVDIVHHRNKGIEQVVIGHILDRKQHPNADKLSVCQVDIGEVEPVQIVCGAPNVEKGQKVPVAKVGAVLPDNFKIKKAKLRGEVSQGMICSAQELGIEDRLVATEFKDGIMVLPEQLEVGSSALVHLELDDYILELDLTPNRSDCLSMLGVAYEVGAILGREVQHPSIDINEGVASIKDMVSVKIEAKELCPHYAARMVKGVKIGQSPLWLQNRLISAGIRPINNVVDIANFIMIEYGQPLHTFDAKQVKDGQIIVRQAREGEQVVTLDDKKRTLKEGMLLITDPEKVLAIAGVMGAANSEVTSETTDIIIESAYFAGQSIRSTSKTLGLRSEASLRFEKGVDSERVYAAANRAAALLVEIAGGEVVQGVAEQKVKEFERTEISVNMVHLNNVLGTTLNTSEVTNILDRLAFDYENKGHEILVDIPTRRPDLRIEEDVMEEVARLYGYDLIPTTLPTGVTTPGSRTKRQKLRRIVKAFLQGTGLDQVVTYSLTSKQNAERGNVIQQHVSPIALAMPMSEERSHLRTTIIPNLLEIASYNKNRKHADTHVFEVGHTFLTKEESLRDLPQEKEMIAGVITGVWQTHPWQQVKVPVDFYALKGIVEGLLEKLEIQNISYEADALDGYHPGRTAWIKHEEQLIGFIGQLHPQLQSDFDLDPTYCFELSLDHLLDHLPQEISYVTLPKFPSIQRDLAVVVNREMVAGNLSSTILEVGAPLLKSVHLFDVYEGERIEAGKKSLAFSLTYQDTEKTLTDEDVAQVHDKIVKELEQKWQADLRK